MAAVAVLSCFGGCYIALCFASPIDATFGLFAPQLPIVYSSNERVASGPSCFVIAALVGALVAYASRGVSLHRQLQVVIAVLSSGLNGF